MTTNNTDTSVDEIIDSKPVYKSGGDGRSGECDCIGLIIEAMLGLNE